jgi:thioredoxin-related protein
VYKIQDKEQQQTMISSLPSFNGLKDLKSLKPNTPSVFIAFSPDCEHCQYEAKNINERRKDLEKAQIILFTSEKDSLTKVFAHTYGLDTLKNVQVISDKNDELYKFFQVESYPSVFIYNKEGQLVKLYKGETKIDAIIKHIQ